jgi:carbon storage regulator
MDIISLQYEEPLVLYIKENQIKIVAFKTDDPRIIKFGVEAPRSVNVHREEIFLAIKEKERKTTEEVE